MTKETSLNTILGEGIKNLANTSKKSEINPWTREQQVELPIIASSKPSLRFNSLYTPSDKKLVFLSNGNNLLRGIRKK